MVVRGGCARACIATGLVLATAASGAAQRPSGEHVAALMRALADMPAHEGRGSGHIEIVDWRTGEPLQDAIAVVLPPSTSWNPRRRLDPIELRATSLELAAAQGERVALDAGARASVPTLGSSVVVVHGEDWVMGPAGVLAPAPLRTIEVTTVDARGDPVPRVTTVLGTTRLDGRLTAILDQELTGSTRYLLCAAGHDELLSRFGMVPPGCAVVDLHASGTWPRSITLTTAATASLEVVGMHAGEHVELGAVGIGWPAPFDLGYVTRTYDAGAATVATALPAGIPLRVTSGRASRSVTLSAGEVARVELEVPAPQRLRYRLVGIRGSGLRPFAALGEGMILHPERRELLVPVTAASVSLQLVTEDGEEWSHAPFTPKPVAGAAAVVDGGDIVFEATSQSEFCRGRVVDTDGKPVRTRVWLGDGSAILATARTDTDGRFRLYVGPWTDGPMPVFVAGRRGSVPTPVSRGRKNVVLTVGPPDTTGCAGRLLGVDSAPFVEPIAARAVRLHDPRHRTYSTPLRLDGSFRLALEPGSYDVDVTTRSGTVLLAAKAVRVADGELARPASLRGPLPPTLRFAHIRIVGSDRLPCPVPLLTRDATATVQAVIPVRGTMLDLPRLLRRVPAKGDVEIVCDPVLTEAAVDGLPAPSPWHFGLRLGAAGGACNAATVELRDGHGWMFVPRGVPLRAELLATLYDAPAPRPLGGPAVIEGFDAVFTVPATRTPKTIRLRAPNDLERQLAVLDAAH